MAKGGVSRELNYYKEGVKPIGLTCLVLQFQGLVAVRYRYMYKLASNMPKSPKKMQAAAQPAEGVLGYIVIPSSRNNGLFLIPAFRKDEFTRSPALEKWLSTSQVCRVEGITEFSDPAIIWSKCRIMCHIHLGKIRWYGWIVNIRVNTEVLKKDRFYISFLTSKFIFSTLL